MQEEYYTLNEVLRELEESLHERSKITKSMKRHIIRLIRGYNDSKVGDIQYRLLAYLQVLRKNRNIISSCLKKTSKALNTIEALRDTEEPSEIKQILSMIHTLLSYALVVDFDVDKKILLKLITISKNSEKFSILNENRSTIMKDYSELQELRREAEKVVKEIETKIK